MVKKKIVYLVFLIIYSAFGVWLVFVSLISELGMQRIRIPEIKPQKIKSTLPQTMYSVLEWETSNLQIVIGAGIRGNKSINANTQHTVRVVTNKSSIW